MTTRDNDWLQPNPLVAILRGVRPDEVVAIGEALHAAGFHLLEVPMNSPDPLESIARLQQALGDRCLVGAGTVRTVAQVAGIAATGARLVVMPHSDASVISEAKRRGMRCVPGVATPTEAFAALDAGADALKVFPAEQIPPDVLKAWRSVLPRDLALLPVGGISPERMQAYVDAGAGGFGIGSALYAPGRDAGDTARRGRDFIAAWSAILHTQQAAP